VYRHPGEVIDQVVAYDTIVGVGADGVADSNDDRTNAAPPTSSAANATTNATVANTGRRARTGTDVLTPQTARLATVGKDQAAGQGWSK
jgi:hypothetical protein